jgi:multidrug efflux pump subunit AcrB
MNISTWSIKNPVVAIVFFILLCVLGVNSFLKKSVQNFPDIQSPLVIITAIYDGATPSQMETEVVKKIENAVATVEGVKHIYSTVVEGTASITVEFQLEKDGANTANEIRDAISQIRADLPTAMREPSIIKVVNAGLPMLTYAVSSDHLDETDLSWIIDNSLSKRLLSLPGVGKFNRLGGVQREIKVELDPLKMAGLSLTAPLVSGLLSQVQIDAPSGRSNISASEQAVRTQSDARTIDSLKALQLPLPSGEAIQLGQIATVEDGIAERRSRAFFNGKPVIAFEISRTEGANEVTVAQSVQQEIAQMVKDYPNLKIELIYNNTRMAQENFLGSMRQLIEGAVLAILVVWLFLRDLRATLIAAVALPLSIIPSYWGMEYFGFSFNVLTLLAFALVVGVLVDDAIVEIENIARHLKMGKPPYQAAIDAVDEIGLAVIATTFALIAVFLPTAFMTGILGRYFQQFGWTAVLAIFASLMVARMLTPVMAAYLLKPDGHTAPKQDSRLLLIYLRTVSWCIKHRGITVMAAVIFFIASLAIIPLLPKGFVPPIDYSQTLVNIELPPGSTLDETTLAAESARLAIRDDPDIVSIFTLIGGGQLHNAMKINAEIGEVRNAVLSVQLKDRAIRSRSQQEIEVALRDKLKKQAGVRSDIGREAVGNKLQLVLKSEDPLALRTTASQFVRELRGMHNIGNVSSTVSLVQPEVRVKIDVEKAADAGVSPALVAETLRIATSGSYAGNSAKFNLTERQLPIQVKMSPSIRTDLDALGRLGVPGKYGTQMIAGVADIVMGSEPAVIKRFDRSQQVTLEVELGLRSLGDVRDEAMQLPAIKSMPTSVTLGDLGDAQLMSEMFGSFSSAMIISVISVFAVLVLLFKDFLQPLTILTALPLAIGGAFVMLLILGENFSMPALIGLLMLMGIVSKNSILLVEYAIVSRRDRGMSRLDALLDSCHKRARPIIMTSMAMGFGMLPVALGWGSEPAFSSPMAVSVIGGLMSSTFLSLLVVPAVYTFVDDFKEAIRRFCRLA